MLPCFRASVLIMLSKKAQVSYFCAPKTPDVELLAPRDGRGRTPARLAVTLFAQYVW